MTNYQRRMSKLVWGGTAYTIAGIAMNTQFNLGAMGWLVFASTSVILYALAVGFDAVFDSLREIQADNGV